MGSVLNPPVDHPEVHSVGVNLKRGLALESLKATITWIRCRSTRLNFKVTCSRYISTTAVPYEAVRWGTVWRRSLLSQTLMTDRACGWRWICYCSIFMAAAHCSIHPARAKASDHTQGSNHSTSSGSIAPHRPAIMLPQPRLSGLLAGQAIPSDDCESLPMPMTHASMPQTGNHHHPQTLLHHDC